MLHQGLAGKGRTMQGMQDLAGKAQLMCWSRHSADAQLGPGLAANMLQVLT